MKLSVLILWYRFTSVFFNKSKSRINNMNVGKKLANKWIICSLLKMNKDEMIFSNTLNSSSLKFK